jgi:hypothetical protein
MLRYRTSPSVPALPGGMVALMRSSSSFTVRGPHVARKSGPTSGGAGSPRRSAP